MLHCMPCIDKHVFAPVKPPKQAADPDSKLSDPKRHSSKRLAEFLASLTGQQPDPDFPDRASVKPKKLLKRLLPWLQQCQQVNRRCMVHCSPAAAKQLDKYKDVRVQWQV